MKTTKRKYNKEFYSIIKELEKKFQRKHRIKFISKQEIEKFSLPDFIYRVVYNCPATKYITSGKNQCHGGANRSLGDIYLLVKNYFPEATLEEILEVIKIKTNIGCHFCYDVKKRVFYIGYPIEGYTDENNLPEDFFKNLRKGKYNAE